MLVSIARFKTKTYISLNYNCYFSEIQLINSPVKLEKIVILTTNHN